MQEYRLSVRAFYTEIQDCQLGDKERKPWPWVKNVNGVPQCKEYMSSEKSGKRFTFKS